MATPKHQQVWDALKTLFGSIVEDGGATYWYTVEAVVDYPEFAAACLNTPKETVYCLAPDVSEVRPMTFDSTEVTAHMRLSMARKFPDEIEDPFNPPNPSRIEIQNRLIQDATKKLNTDEAWKLGTTAIRAEVTAEDRSVENTFWKGWAIAHLSLRVLYSYPDEEP